MPERRRTAKSCSRNCTGMSRRRASSPIGTGPAPPLRPSSARAFSAYGLLDVIEIMGLPWRSYVTADPDRARTGAHGRHLRPLGAAGPVVGAGHVGPLRAQAR